MTQHRTTARRVDASLSSSSMLWFFASRIKTPIRHTSTAFQKNREGLVGSQGLKYIEKDTPNVNACAEIRFQKWAFPTWAPLSNPKHSLFLPPYLKQVEHSVIFSNKWPIWQGQMYVKSQSSFLDKENCHSALFFQSSQLLSPSLLTFKHSKLAEKSRIK